jgi:hypothetical protein
LGRACWLYGTNLGTSFNQGAESAPPPPPFIKVNELFGELVVPLLKEVPLIQKLSVEAAYCKLCRFGQMLIANSLAFAATCEHRTAV